MASGDDPNNQKKPLRNNDLEGLGMDELLSLYEKSNIAEGEIVRGRVLKLTPSDVEHPQDYILLGYTIDSRTGLGTFENYFMRLVKLLKEMPIEEVLKDPEVRARIDRIRNEQEEFKDLLQRNSFRLNNVITPNLVDLSSTLSVCGDVPFSMAEGVELTVAWMRDRRVSSYWRTIS